jgi:5-methylcytosine-specific restriction endonuclease McrA
MSVRVPADLREFVRQRARRLCEYCLLHEEDAIFRHVPDHVIARKHRGETHEANLAWSCYECNQRKGSDLASIDPETGRISRLFHPRKDSWSDHFRLRGPRILPLTAVGRVTEFLFRLNHPRALSMRRVLIQAGCYPR